MLKLVAALVVLGALVAGVFLVPVRGRTIADRWAAAPGPGAFAKNAWNEAAGVLSGDRKGPVPPPSDLAERSRRRPRPSKELADARRGARGEHAAAPVEHHTAEDRAALDRLLSERSR